MLDEIIQLLEMAFEEEDWSLVEEALSKLREEQNKYKDYGFDIFEDDD